MSEIYPIEFAEFFEAMSAKMATKRLTYGNSWKNIFVEKSNVPMAIFLNDRLEGELKEYFESGEPKELVDVANVCAMLWCRAKKGEK